MQPDPGKSHIKGTLAENKGSLSIEYDALVCDTNMSSKKYFFFMH